MVCQRSGKGKRKGEGFSATPPNNTPTEREIDAAVSGDWTPLFFDLPLGLARRGKARCLSQSPDVLWGESQTFVVDTNGSLTPVENEVTEVHSYPEEDRIAENLLHNKYLINAQFNTIANNDAGCEPLIMGPYSSNRVMDDQYNGVEENLKESRVDTTKSAREKRMNIKFALEKTLPLPRLPTNVILYIRNLRLYNCGVHTGRKNEANFYVWTEDTAGKGSREPDTFVCFLRRTKSKYKCSHIENFFAKVTDASASYHDISFFRGIRFCLMILTFLM
ncbi:hypothetical protein PR048_015676 [Dryococelus australis]|uniref:Uncharacterized protein n=1 Tax=Dryococelus australis TaxID=614101 RepID=A0ABQ9HI49_9NEOP|nr:hypothetical protein PR048_015676 [Dryococelus australis]